MVDALNKKPRIGRGSCAGRFVLLDRAAVIERFPFFHCDRTDQVGDLRGAVHFAFLEVFFHLDRLLFGSCPVRGVPFQFVADSLLVHGASSDSCGDSETPFVSGCPHEAEAQKQRSRARVKHRREAVPQAFVGLARRTVLDSRAAERHATHCGSLVLPVFAVSINGTGPAGIADPSLVDHGTPPRAEAGRAGASIRYAGVSRG